MGLGDVVRRVGIGALTLATILNCNTVPRELVGNNINRNGNSGGHYNGNSGGNNGGDYNGNSGGSGGNNNGNSNGNFNGNGNSGGESYLEADLIVEKGFKANISPSGNKVVFMRLHYDEDSNPYLEGQTDIWMVGLDGSGLKRVTNTSEDEFNPKWTPDGQKIVFARTEGNYFTHDPGKLFATDFNGNNEQPFFQNHFADLEVEDFCFYTRPNESYPDGIMRSIVYVDEGGVWLTHGGEYYDEPSHSALRNQERLTNLNSGEQSEYIVANDSTISDLVVFDPFDLDESVLDGNVARFPFPAISPNGQKIVAGADGGTGSGLYVMNLDGSELMRLTDETDLAPTWNGSKVVFTRIFPDGTPYSGFEFGDIYKVDLEE